MTRFFSPSTRGFYDEDLHRDMPPDAVELADDAYEALLAAQAEGQSIAVVANSVQAIEPPPPTPDAQLAIVRARRGRLLAATDAMVTVPDFPISETRRAELIVWRARLRDVPAALDPAAPFDTVAWPDPPAWMDDRGKIIAVEAN